MGYYVIGLCLTALLSGALAVPVGEQRNDCGFACIDDWTPVCATNSSGSYVITCSNACYLAGYNCNHNTNFTILYDGECSGWPTTNSDPCM
ncbi:turripeptide Pal9.2-like [Bacillus rossius redtenbacheri]|uniref:turripeptide Pal9.2-like n=1 Tax=Bacillus rossius redtenbacheri TaxID=93214 RepID=UPI002FDCDF6A